VDYRFINLIVNSNPLSINRRGIISLEQIETHGIIISSQCKIESTEKKKTPHKKNTTEILDYATTLEILEKDGLIKKNSAGKFCITKKGNQRLLKSFKIGRK
jgi:hypothetical protein